LIEFARLHALGTAQAPGLPEMTRFADITQGLLRMEMDLHRSYAGGLGISRAQLEREEMLPTTQGYTDFLVRTGAVGDPVDLTAALLPCIWGYAEIAQRLAADGTLVDERYRRWIAKYTSPEFAQLVGWARELTDRAGEDVGAAGAQRARRAFSPAAAMSSRSGRWPGLASTGSHEAYGRARPDEKGVEPGLRDSRHAGPGARNRVACGQPRGRRVTRCLRTEPVHRGRRRRGWAVSRGRSANGGVADSSAG